MSDTYGRKYMLMFTSGLNLIGYIFLFISLSSVISGIGSIAGYSLGFILFILSRIVTGLGGAGF